MNRSATACLLLALALSPTLAADPAVPPASSAPIPAGVYRMDPSHTSVLFRVSHLGFSNYTARFRRSDAELQFDPANLARSSVSVTIDARSLETDYSGPVKIDFNATLQAPNWLDTARFPQITYRSTSVEATGTTMRITGDLSLRGVTRPVVLVATFNGGYAGHPFDPQARVGFSARGTLKRSEFGISEGIPAPGTTLGVSDEVEVIIETEFQGPPLAQPG